jgi:hypothetical protein
LNYDAGYFADLADRLAGGTWLGMLFAVGAILCQFGVYNSGVSVPARAMKRAGVGARARAVRITAASMGCLGRAQMIGAERSLAFLCDSNVGPEIRQLSASRRRVVRYLFHRHPITGVRSRN